MAAEGITSSNTRGGMVSANLLCFCCYVSQSASYISNFLEKVQFFLLQVKQKASELRESHFFKQEGKGRLLFIKRLKSSAF